MDGDDDAPDVVFVDAAPSMMRRRRWNAHVAVATSDAAVVATAAASRNDRLVFVMVEV
jgi:uncharacterized protein (DUF58 family)